MNDNISTLTELRDREIQIKTTGRIINQEMINDLKIDLNTTYDVLDFLELY